MGPNKAVVKGDAIYDARTGKLIQDGLSNEHVLADYASHHYLALPEVDKAGQPWTLNGQPVYCIRGCQFAKISQETLAEMVGTTRSRVSFFLNRFRKLCFIQYNGGIHVHSSLLNVVLHD